MASQATADVEQTFAAHENEFKDQQGTQLGKSDGQIAGCGSHATTKHCHLQIDTLTVISLTQHTWQASLLTSQPDQLCGVLAGPLRPSVHRESHGLPRACWYVQCLLQQDPHPCNHREKNNKHKLIPRSQQDHAMMAYLSEIAQTVSLASPRTYMKCPALPLVIHSHWCLSIVWGLIASPQEAAQHAVMLRLQCVSPLQQRAPHRGLLWHQLCSLQRAVPSA